MKKHIASLVFTFTAFLIPACVALAQEGAADVTENAEFAAVREMIQQTGEAFIREELRLSDEEAADFWPLYREYRLSIEPIHNRYITLVADYMQHYRAGTLDDENAERMLDSYFDIKSDRLKTRKRYIRKFKKVLPMLKVTRFYQLETKMNADIDAVLALTVPLAER